MVCLQHRSIEVQDIIAAVFTPEAGAVDVFIGTTRNHSRGKQVDRLDYEAYEPMALNMMERLVEDAKQRWPVHRIALVHRLGEVPIGEPSVVIAVSAAHRHEAFSACRFLIEELKRVVPIWKREHFTDGSSEWSLHRPHEQTLPQEP